MIKILFEEKNFFWIFKIFWRIFWLTFSFKKNSFVIFEFFCSILTTISYQTKLFFQKSKHRKRSAELTQKPYPVVYLDHKAWKCLRRTDSSLGTTFFTSEPWVRKDSAPSRLHLGLPSLLHAKQISCLWRFLKTAYL